MIAVIFEVSVREDAQNAYPDAAAALSDVLQQADGLISIERFQSISTPGKLLSRRSGAMKLQWPRGVISRNTASPSKPDAKTGSPATACALPACCATTACMNGRRHRRTAISITSHLLWKRESAAGAEDT
jgi:hypothetical protein